MGALTSAAYRFRSRPFDLVSTPSIAEHDACGSAIRVDHRRGQVMRRLAGDDPEVNEEWITDKDRFAFATDAATDRLTRPLVARRTTCCDRRPGRRRSIAVRPGLCRAGRQPVGVLTGGRLTVEDAYAYAKFARAVLGTNNIDFRSRPHSDEEADFLAAAVAGTGLGVTYADLESADSVLLVCFEPEEEAGAIFLRLRKADPQDAACRSRRSRPTSATAPASSAPRWSPPCPAPRRAALDRLPADDEVPRSTRTRSSWSASGPPAVRHPERLPPAGRAHRRPAGLGSPPGR